MTRAQRPAFAVLLAALVAVGGLWPSPASGGPWTREPGHWYAKLAQGVFAAEGFRDSSGSWNGDAPLLALTSSFYAELSTLERLHLQAYLPFVVGINRFAADSALRQSTLCDNGRRAEQTLRRGFGDAVAGAQWTSPWLASPHALRVLAKLPLYDVGQPGGSCGALFPQAGDGQLDVDLWLSLGDSFAAGDLFAFAEIGHRFRTEVYLAADSGQHFADTFLAYAQCGFQASSWALLMLGVNLAVLYAEDDVTKGYLSVMPALFAPLGEGFALELALELMPWAVNSAVGRVGSFFVVGASLGLSHRSR